MNPWIVAAIVVAAVLAIWGANKLGWIDLSDKSGGGGGGGAFGAVDEIFRPAKYEIQLEKDRQSSMPAPAPLAGGDDLGIFGKADAAKVHIRLDEFGRPVDEEHRPVDPRG